MQTNWLLLGMLTSLMFCSCANRTMRITPLVSSCDTATPRLKQAWKDLNEAIQSPGGCSQGNGTHCDLSRAQIERMSVDCPKNPDVVMANALLAFEARNLIGAQQLLDELLGMSVAYPEAASLRARIALQQGNSKFAIRFLEEQIQISGDDPGLREIYASALYLSGRYDEAQSQLMTAQRFGSPSWRIAFGQGLVEEAKGRFNEAASRYQDALKIKPGWKQAESHLRALEVSGRLK